MASSLKLPYLDKGVLIINLCLLSINSFIFILASEVHLIEILSMYSIPVDLVIFFVAASFTFS